MKAKPTIAFLFATLAILFTAGSASALDKTGTYSGTYFFHSGGDSTDLGNGDSYFNGWFNGVFSNDAGSGFLHNAAGACPAAAALIGDQNYYQGNCIMTDQDGDRAVLEWKCSWDADGQCPGDFYWVGGTGKYEGIQGKSSFVGNTISGGPQGFAPWVGEWKLP